MDMPDRQGRPRDLPSGPLPSGPIAVTGATGFIGTHLVERLLGQGRRVIAMGRSVDGSWRDRVLSSGPEGRSGHLVTEKGELEDRSYVARSLEGAQALVHLAAEQPHGSSGAPLDIFARNLRMALAVAVGAAEARVPRVVWASSALVYGTRSPAALSEDRPLAPSTPYASAKAASEEIALGAGRVAGSAVTVVRLFNCYGPGQSANAFLGSLLAQAAGGGGIRLHHLSGVRDFVHVDDVVRGLLLAAARPSGDPLVVNLGTGVGTSLSEALDLFRALAAGDHAITLSDRDDAPRPLDHLVANPARARATLGWTPAWTLEDGMADLLARQGMLGRWPARRSPAG